MTCVQPLEEQPAEHRCRRGDERVHDRLCRDAVRGECRARVEARPAEPQDAGADHRQRQAVRRHRPIGIALAHAEHEDQCERRSARVHVHDRSTGEVEGALACEPPAGKDHVRDRRVHDDQPHGDEDHVGGELHPVSSRSRDQRWRDDRERHLERAEQHERDRERSEEPIRIGQRGPDILHPREVEVADEALVARVAERQAEGDRAPQDPEDPHREEVLHQHAEHVLRADHAAVEERQARGHEQH